MHAAMKLTVILTICLAALAVSAMAATHSTTVTGRVFCRIGGQSFPMKEALVKVFDDDFFLDDLVGTTETGQDGTFYVSGNARDIFGFPHIYVAVFHIYSTLLEIDGLFGTPRFYRTPTKQVQEYLDFGDIFISDDHCRAYVHFYDAVNDYANRTGEDLPYGTLHVRSHAVLHVGYPYSVIREVFVPRDYPLDLETAKHEVAHTVRHFLDGDLSHLVYDAVRFNYLRPHYCGFKSNEGFAFNEGWAEFWAGSCTAYSYGGNPYDFTIEGNVANGLRQLQATYGLSDFDMVDILDNSNSTIHSFYEYESALIQGFLY